MEFNADVSSLICRTETAEASQSGRPQALSHRMGRSCSSLSLLSVLQAGREGVASCPGSDARLGLDVVEGGRTALDNKTSLLNTPSPRSFSGPRGREFSPYGYGETICTYDKSALKEAVFDDDVEQFRDCELQ